MEESDALKAAKKILKTKKELRKKLKWEKLKNDLNKDSWGLGYKIVMRKFGAQKPTPNLPTLFPEHEERHEIIKNNVVSLGLKRIYF